MTATDWISLVKAIILALVIGSLGITFLIIYNRNSREKNRIQEFSTTSNLTIDSSIAKKLDEFIQENLTDYLVINIHLTENTSYITEELENQIREGFATYISDRLSPIFMQQLSLYYNIDNIDQVLANKIYIIVTAYVTAYNTPEDDGRDIVLKGLLPDYTDMRNSGTPNSNNVVHLDPSINF